MEIKRLFVGTLERAHNKDAAAHGREGEGTRHFCILSTTTKYGFFGVAYTSVLGKGYNTFDLALT
jgi:hypothetical protein